jgi:DNA-binding FrmR family transcriptional regulator
LKTCPAREREELVMSTTDSDAQRRILNRLRRARGQLDAVISAVEEDKPCRDVVTQLAAVSSALDRAGFMIVSTALRECLVDPDAAEAQDGVTPEELEKLFMMLA